MPKYDEISIKNVLIISHFQTLLRFKHGERLPQHFLHGLHHEHISLLICIPQIFQKYNVHRIRTAQKSRTNFKPRQAYLLQQSYSQTSVELGPNLGQIIQQDKPNTTAQLLQGSSGARAKIWSNYTQDKAYILQHSYSHTPVDLEPKVGQILQDLA